MRRHNKLVRDKIPAICKAAGEMPKTRIIKDDAQFLKVLCDKLIEEAKEVQETPVVEELADVLEVVLAVGKMQGYTPAQIEKARREKAEKRGGFDARIFLETTSPNV